MFLDLSYDELNNVPELGPITTDAEVELEINDVKVGNDKNGNPYMLVRHKILNHDDAATFTKFFKLPVAGMDADARNKALRTLKYFFSALGYEWSGTELDPTSLIGYTCWAFIGLDESSDEFGPQNYIKKYISNA